MADAVLPSDSATRKATAILYRAFAKAYPRTLPDDWDEQEGEQADG